MTRRSYLDCPHNNMQQFTECCLDCGYNVWTSKEEYLRELQREADKVGADKLTKSIRDLEKKLGIT